jgi:hypothetical protein
MTPTEQFTDVVYANRVFGAVCVRQRTRQLVAELGFPESILGPAPIPPPPPLAHDTVWADPDGERELAELRRQWLAGERLRLMLAPPDTHSHLRVLGAA